MKKFIKKCFGKIDQLLNRPKSDIFFYLRYIFYKNLSIEVSNTRLNFSTNDLVSKRWFFPRYRDGSMHEPIVTKQLIKEFEDNTIFFDIGANVGFFTVLAQNLCKQGQAHAFELDPVLVELINKNVKLNEGGKVVINSTAVMEDSRDLIKFSPAKKTNKSTNSVTAKTNSKQKIQVPTLSIDDYCSKKSITPNILKIDVEGAELSVLKGMKEVLKNKSLHALFVEVHPNFVQEPEIFLKDMSKILREFNLYKFTNRRSGKEDQIEKINDLTKIKGNKMILAKRKNDS